MTISMSLLAMVLMLGGTLLMIEKKDVAIKDGNKWMIYAVLSATFAALLSFFVKLGLVVPLVHLVPS